MNFLSIYIAVVLTAYSPEIRQTDQTPFITAYNRPVKECMIAVSRDLEDIGFINGKSVYVTGITECNGVFIVGDRMHWRHRLSIDLFFFNTSDAWNFGRKHRSIILLD